MPFEWFDISVPIRDGMVHWPDDMPVSLSQELSLEAGDSASVTSLKMSAHTGTHIDAPSHFLGNAKSVHEIPEHLFFGVAKVISVEGVRAIGEDVLKRHGIQHGDTVLLKTDNSKNLWYRQEFNRSYTGLSRDGAEYLSEREVAGVGIDYLSIGTFGAENEKVHRALLQKEILIIEGLYLDGVEEGNYEFICLPLKIEGADGSPARMFLREQ